VELRRHADPIVVVDDVAHVRAISAAAVAGGVTVRALVEIEIGMNRCGVAPGEGALLLARQSAESPGLKLAGIMGWEGHLLTIADLAEKAAKITAAMKVLDETRRLIIEAGLPCPIVSAGGTGSFQITGTLGLVTELQAGGAVFMDLFYRNQCHVEEMEFSLSILASVISCPTPNRAVIDAGRKTMSPDLHLPQVKGRTDLQMKWLSAEHGILEVVATPGPVIGDRVELIPGYGDWTTILHDRYYVFRGERLEAIWELDARERSE
jgi:D-serine deaminase-like pyridoxal phosphate-dependent protein